MKVICIILVLFITALFSCGNNEKSSAAKVTIPQQRDTTFEKVIRSDDDWRKIMTPEQFRVMRKKGTERPFTGKYNSHKEKGIYECSACAFPLFSSGAKFESGTGWPSFYEPLNDYCILYEDDFSLGMQRNEVMCARCEGHLGHVFEDGPKPTGLRYCINSVSLNFVAE